MYYLSKIALISSIYLLVNATGHAGQIRTVVLSHTPAPSTFNGSTSATFSSYFIYPVMNSSGKIAFPVILEQDSTVGHGVSLTAAIYVEENDSLRLVARTGTQAVGLSEDVTFGHLTTGVALPIFYVGDQLVFNALLEGDSVDLRNRASVWAYKQGALEIIARGGDVTPGLRNEIAGPPSAQGLNTHGQIAIRASIRNDLLSGSGVWLFEGGNQIPVATGGEFAPGTPEDVIFHQVGLPTSLNASGNVAFRATLSGPDVSSSFNGEGIWTDRSGSLELIVRAGEPAIGVTDGSYYWRLGELDFNVNSQIAFRADLIGQEVNDSNDVGIWSEGNGELALIAREGDPAPGFTSDAMGAPAEYRYSRLGRVELSDSGQTIFSALVSGPGIDDSNSLGFWSADADSVELLLQEGMQAPGVGKASRFVDMDSPQVNALGQIAFSSQLVGEGINGLNDVGIWATDVAGNLQQVVREGDQIETAPGEFRTIDSFTFQSPQYPDNGDGNSRWFNERGQIMFVANFRDGISGIFVTNTVAIPEPGSLVQLAVASLLLTLRGSNHNAQRQ